MCPAVGGAATVGRRHTWVPPYREICKTCVGAAALPRPSMNTAFSKTVIPRSEATWESVSPLRQRTMREGYGLPHQSADWFAMTFFEGAAGNSESSGTPTPTDARFAYVGQKTNTAPTAAKDDALHRDTTLLRRPLTQNGLTECRYTPALSRAPPFGSEVALRPSTRRLRSHVPPSVPRPLSPARALFGGLKWGTLSFTAFYDPVKFFNDFSPRACRGEK